MNGFDSMIFFYHIESNQIFFFSLNRWTRAFRTHIEEMHVRLKNGDIHAQISNATSRALTGDTSLSVSLWFEKIIDYFF